MSIAETVPRVRIPFAPPASLNRRETAPRFAAKYAKMPVFRNISSAKQTGENGLPGINGVNLPAFLWTAHAQSGFSEFNGRMQRDHKPMMWRKSLDLVASRSPSLNPVAFAQTSRAVPPNLAKVILNTIRRLELPQDFSGTTTASRWSELARASIG